MSYENLWIEKYRPKTLEDLCITDDIRDLIKEWGNEIPHLLFVGKAGTGKTTLAQILVNNVLDCDYLYINASDENGIDTIRTKVTGFVQTKSLDGNIKVVVLDEADGLTIDGQKCLRNLMESYASTARFILTGNSLHKISVALQSRCQRLVITTSLSSAVKRCLSILKLEGVTITDVVKRQVITLVKEHFPDLRMCIGELAKHCVGGVLKIEHKTTSSELLETVWSNIQHKKGLATRKYLIENDALFNSDWDQLLVDLLNYIYKQDCDDSMKKAMVVTIADHLERATRVLDKEINVFACILNLES
jgi:replication-associated recombination protein RarA